jgi:sulfoxide reductase heme-binding subunit YedZ
MTPIQTNKFAGRYSMDWKVRHLLTLVLAGVGTYAFLKSRAEWPEMPRWNRAVGDMSFVLIATSMAIGPLFRLITKVRGLIAWRRELGIYGVLLAIVHLIIILVGWVEWDFIQIFGCQFHPAGFYVMIQHGFGLANVIGLIALVYGIVLALTSSNWSQRVLDGPV